MSGPQESSTWQALLGQLITNPSERDRLAAAVRVRSITLQRWAEGSSRPRNENIRMLLRTLPRSVYPLFLRLLIVDFPELAQEELPEEHFLQSLPTEFYRRAMSNLALTPQPMYRQSMQDLILQQALEHLDPDRQGLAIALVVCVPPRPGGRVRSLREIGGLATPPWPHNLPEKPMFLGAESLVGYAISKACSCVINSSEEITFFPVHWTEHERSAAAFPIFRQGRVAGGLVVSCVEEYFFTAPRLSVIEDYSYLATCIFEPEDTFRFDEVELRIMPPYVQQLPYFHDYKQRVSQKFVEADERGHHINLQQARQLVWQDLEDLLLRVSQHVRME